MPAAHDDPISVLPKTDRTDILFDIPNLPKFALLHRRGLALTPTRARRVTEVGRIDAGLIGRFHV